LASFQSPGTTPKFKLSWNKIVSGLTNDWKTAFKHFGGRLSGPAGLEIFKIWNWSHTSCSLMTMPDSSQGASGGTSGRSGSESKLDTDVR
jgi:hypothetical protein